MADRLLLAFVWGVVLAVLYRTPKALAWVAPAVPAIIITTLVYAAFDTFTIAKAKKDENEKS